MHKRIPKALLASILAVATVAPTVAMTAVPLSVSAGQVLGETTFDNKALPWHTCETSPAAQTFEVKDAFHITITEAVGGEKSKWDLQFRHRNLNFKKGHRYTVSFEVKASRDGMELCSKIGNIKGDQEYFSLMSSGQMEMGYHMGGQWGTAVQLSTSYKKFSGTFVPTQDLDACEWTFHYANDSNGFGGNARNGDELWFDNMSIICEDCDDCDADPTNSFGATSRDWGAAKNEATMMKGGKSINFISVNQVGYYSNLRKTAVLGDNQGDVLPNGTSIDLSGTYTYELVDATTNKVVHTGTTGAATPDADSADTVCKIDFTAYKEPGRYYLRIKDKDWRSFEFNIGDNIYTDKTHDMLTNAINYFYQNRSGLDIKSEYITSGDKSTLAHEGGHTTDKAAVQTQWKNEYASKDEATGTYRSSDIIANKGWYDAGDHGKYVVNGGISVWTLLNMYERAIQTAEGKAKFADGSGTVVIPETGNDIPDIIDETMYELAFMKDMIVKSDEPTWGSKYAGMVYHKLHDHKWTGLATRPYNYEKEWDTTRIVKPPTYAATLNVSACMAQAARLLAPYDSKTADEYYEIAQSCYDAAKANYKPAAANELTNPTSLYAPFNQAKGGGPYGDDEVRDDFYWAACEIFVTASERGDSSVATKYQGELEDYGEAYLVTDRITGGENATGEGSFTTFNWGNTASAGSMTLALHKDLLSDANAKKLDDSIIKTAKSFIAEEEKQGYGIPYKYDGPGYTDENNLDPSIVIKGYEWGSNSMVINNLIAIAYAYDLKKTTDPDEALDYMNGVATGMNYLLGCNPLSFSFVSGYGTYKLQNPHHRYWSYELDKELPMAPDGVLSGGPNAGLQDPYVRALAFVPGAPNNPSQRCYVDSIEAWSTNEVTINWNAPLAWIVSFLQDEAATAGESRPGDVDPPTPGDTDWGNVDCSEGASHEIRVDVSDAVLLARYLATDSGAKVTDQGKLNADVNASGSPDTDDVLKILRYLARLIPYEELGQKS